MVDKKNVPVITIDGPSGTGKGTMSAWLAEKLHWHWLDSGAIYRALAWVLLDRGIVAAEVDSSIDLLRDAQITVGSDIEDGCSTTWVRCGEEDISAAIRTEDCSRMASQVSAVPAVRELVLAYQRTFCQPPGLVTDGRDMGTVVFPGARLKIFLTASSAERAKRRYLQLQEKGVEVSLAAIEQDMEARDARDKERSVSPAIPAADAVLLDTSSVSIDGVQALIWEQVERCGLVSG